MQLIITLMVAVAVLTILSGITTLVGSKKRDRSNAVWLSVLTLGLALWGGSIAWFMALGMGEAETAKVLIVGIIAGITLADIGILGYCGWNYKWGRASLAILSLVGVFVVGTLALHPELFYSEIDLNEKMNRIEVVKGWYYYFLMVYYTINTLTFSGFLLKTIKKTANKNRKNGLKIFYIGTSICGLLALVFDLILLSSVPEFIWVGPMSLSVLVLAYYYSVVRYRVIVLSSRWMKVLSLIIFTVFGIVLYLVIFYLVFMALFKIPNPSWPVLLLNLIMTAIVLCLTPAALEIVSFMQSMIMINQINIGYISRKLNKLIGEKVDAKELAGFLADHLHYDYIGFLINGKLYGSGNIGISSKLLEKAADLGAPETGIWQEVDEKTKDELEQNGVEAIAALFDDKGRQFGQVIFGKRSFGVESLSRKEEAQIEFAVNLTALVLNPKSRTRK